MMKILVLFFCKYSNFQISTVLDDSLAEFREISKISFSSLNCHFLQKITKNDNWGEFLDFYQFTLDIIFAIFMK